MAKQFNSEELVLHISDIHYGQTVASEHNLYNTDIAKVRLNYYFDKVTRIGRDIYSRTIPIEKAHIFITGDCITNETMRGSQMMAAEMNFIEQINGVGDLLSDNIANMLMRWKGLKEVHIYGVTGNHGRMGKPGDNDPAANLDRAVYDRLFLGMQLNKAALKPLQDRKIICHFPRRGETVVGRVAKHTFVAHHGDGVKSQLGVPYYGLSRLRDRLYKMFKGNMDVLLLGHFHRAYQEYDGSIVSIICPSLVGWDEYIGKMGACHYAAQNLYLVHPQHGITSMRSINVSDIQSVAN